MGPERVVELVVGGVVLVATAGAFFSPELKEHRRGLWVPLLIGIAFVLFGLLP